MVIIYHYIYHILAYESVERIPVCRRLLAKLEKFIVGAGGAAGELEVQATNLAGARFVACTSSSPAAPPAPTINFSSLASSLRHPALHSTDSYMTIYYRLLARVAK